MADSIDRVFGHALNTVNKIRTGTAKPPSSQRLKLYGLYKQAMEGDVGYLQPRPTASPTTSPKEFEKWDAWNAVSGLTRTQAKIQYIELLIGTMHEYATDTTESKELVEELEFVWDQVRNNSVGVSGSSDVSSPLRERPRYPGLEKSEAAGFDGGDERHRSPPMQVLNPMGQVDEQEDGQEEEEEEKEEEEFVDAPDSQFEGGEDSQKLDDDNEEPSQTRPTRKTSTTTTTKADTRWKKRVESAIVKMTTEVAALREQLESRSYIAQKRRHSLVGWMLRLSWFAVKLAAVNSFVLWLLILYLRRKKDRRLEGAVRVLLGDAVAQMQKVGSNMKVPKLSVKKA